MKKVLTFIFVSVCAFFAMGFTAFADTGPKPSLTINVTGDVKGKYYIALLSPYETHYTDEEVDKLPSVRRELYDFSLTDEYYLYDFSPVDRVYYEMTGSDSATWGYHPPQEFKILLYFPESGSFIVSEKLEKYAFSSYFTVKVNDGAMTVEPNGGVRGVLVEIGGLLLRIVLTVLIEIGVARGFGIFGKKAFRLIIIINVVTQLLLNALLWKANFDLGGLGVMLALLGGEILVFVIEVIVYGNALPAFTGNDIKSGRAAGYAFVANLASFLGGGVLMLLTSLIFRLVVRV